MSRSTPGKRHLFPAPLDLVRDNGPGFALYRNNAGRWSIIASPDGWHTTTGSKSPSGLITWDWLPPRYMRRMAQRLLDSMEA